RRWLLCEMRQEGARRMHHTPEIDVDQPFHLRLFDLVEVSEQSDTGIVDDDVERGVRGGSGYREIRDLAGLADIDTVHADLALSLSVDLGGDLLQAGLVAIRQRQVAAARGQF